MPGGFLYSDVIAGASLTSSAASVSTMPLSNLQDPQPRVRTRFVGGTVSILADLLASRSLDCVYLGSTTLTSGATIRVRLSASDVTGAAGEAWDTGVVSASTGDEANGQVVVVRTAGTAAGRYLLVELVDATLPVVDVGILAAGALLRLDTYPVLGQVTGRRILDQRLVNSFTGAQFPMPALRNPRFEAFTIDLISEADVIGDLRTMLARTGAWRDGLYIPDIDATQSELNNRSIWGALAEPGQDVGSEAYNVGAYRRAWRVVERL